MGTMRRKFVPISYTNSLETGTASSQVVGIRDDPIVMDLGRIDVKEGSRKDRCVWENLIEGEHENE